MRNSSLFAISQGIISDSDPRQVQAGSITFMQRRGSSLNLNLHDHFIFLEGVYLDRSAQGLKPKFVKLSAPSDADIATVVTTIS
jgi:Putative transposase